MIILFNYLTETQMEFAKAKRMPITYINESKCYWSKYKIGKAGETAQERFSNGYNEVYDQIKVLFSSDDPDLASKMEKDLIDEFKL